MIKLTSIIFMLVFLVGCTSTFPFLSSSPGGAADADRLSVALKKLELENDPSLLKKLSATDPPSTWSMNADSMLRIHTAQQKKITSLNKKNKDLSEENSKLTEKLNKLNQINLEMEKRSP